MRHKYEAEDILRKLEEGQTFEDCARRWSLCSSAQRGGDLGRVRAHQLHEDFLEAYLTLGEGEVSKSPVRTPFGFHILRRNESSK